ncbi:MAG: beta-galactosidase [Bacteroidales bacterium]|nr:beta-galactosidase [Bacteroidales bacterium]
MNIKAVISVIFLLLFGVFSEAREVISINDGWTFVRESCSTVVNLPHTWNADDCRDDVKGYWRGCCTYSRTVDMPALRDGHAYLRIGAANQVCRVRVNGDPVGEHKGGYTAFCFDVTSFVREGSNDIVLEVDNSFDPDIAPTSADFTFFGGVYRDVELILTGKDDICCTYHGSSGVFVSTPEVSEESSTVRIRTLIGHGGGFLVQKVYAPDGTQVAGKRIPVRGRTEIVQEILLSRCRLWDVDNPSLYTLETSLTGVFGRTRDKVENVFGLRSFDFSACDGFSLNGRPLKLMGASRHQDYEFLGNALAHRHHVSDARLLKEMGANYVRTAHYPQDRSFMTACDSLGLLSSVEIPVVDYATPSEAFLENAKEQLRDMIYQNFNSPSIIMWGYMNEPLLSITFRMKASQSQKDAYDKSLLHTARELNSLAKELDPGRKTLLCCADDIPGYTRCGIVDVPDVLGWNMYRGWYVRTMDEFGPVLDQLHAMFPEKPLIISEYGVDVDPRLHSDRPEKFDFSAEYGLEFHRCYVSEILSRPFISGGNVWILSDFYSEARADAVPHVNSKGITSLSRVKKNTYYFYKALLDKTPVLEIGDKDWPLRSGNAGSSRAIPVFSNSPAVTLSVGGKDLEEKKVDSGVAWFDVILEDGDNFLQARAGNLTDTMTVFYNAVDMSSFSRLDVMLGGSRYMMADGVCWIPEQPYRKGSWGYVGGIAARPRCNGRDVPCNNASIPGTDLDPLYQSQRVGIEAFKADVPAGCYRVILHFAELATGSKASVLEYNLGNDIEAMDFTVRVFNVSVNGVRVISDFNIRKEAGVLRPVQKSFDVRTDGRTMEITFEKSAGSPVLNGIQIINLIK